MKKIIRLDQIIIISIGILSILFIVIWVNRYIDDSKLKITEDISTNDSAMIQNEFGITLPPQAKITALGFSYEHIAIRIEGVENLPSFLTDSIHLELDAKELDALKDRINHTIKDNNQEYEDLYGTNRQSAFFLNSNYQTNPIDSSTITSFFLIDDKLVIEISKSRTTSENREAIKEIVGA